MLMKVYLPDMNIHAMQITDDVAGLSIKESAVVQVFCPDGVYEVEDGKVCRLEFVDRPAERTSVNGVNVIIDRSSVKRHGHVTNIGANSHVCSVDRCEYGLRRGARITLVVESVRSKISQAYLKTEDDVNSYAIAEDFTTLLSLFS
jgi:hypothetical protein